MFPAKEKVYIKKTKALNSSYVVLMFLTSPVFRWKVVIYTPNVKFEIKYNSIFNVVQLIFPSQMEPPRNKRKLAAVNKSNYKEHPKNNSSRDTNVPRMNADYVIWVTEEMDGRKTEKLFENFTRTKSRTPDFLPNLDDFLLNPQVRMQSGTVPETSYNCDEGKPAVRKGSFPELSSSWRGYFNQQVPLTLWF